MYKWYGSVTTRHERKLSLQKYFGLESGSKPVSSGIGFLFATNLLIGNGFLAIPFAFYHAGIIAGAISLVLVTIISCVTSFWTLEVMSRAQGLEYSKEHIHSYVNQRAEPEGLSQTSSDDFQRSYRQPLPIYEVLSTRKFEFSELCDIFLGRGFKMMYIVALFFYMTFVSWSYATVVGTTWSSVIPWRPSHSWEECDSNDFRNVYVPSDVKCKETYWFYTALFGMIVIPLSCFELRGQKFIQVATAILRLVSILLMTGQAFYEITQSDTFISVLNKTDWSNRTIPTSNHSSPSAFVRVISFNPLEFKPVGWLWSIPVFMHAQIMQQNIPAVSYQIKKPERLGKIILSAFVFSSALDIAFGTTVAWRYRGYTSENVVLNWVDQRNSDDFTLSAIAYTVLLLPSFELISLFPIMTLTLANNIFVCIWGTDTSISKVFIRNARLKLIALRITMALIPILGAMAVANLFYVVKYAGITGIIVAFVFPGILQYKSRIKCKVAFPTSPVDRRTETAGSDMHDNLFVYKDLHKQKVKEKIRLIMRGEEDTPYSTACSGCLCITLIMILVSVCLICTLLVYVLYH